MSGNPQEHPIDDAILSDEAAPQKMKPVVVELERKPGVHYNGFQRPFHPLQVVSWFVFFFDLLTYFLINMVSLMHHSLGAVVFFSVLYLVISAFILYYAIVATRIDPSDPTIREQRLVEAQG